MTTRDTIVHPLEGTPIESVYMVEAVSELIGKCYHPHEIYLTFTRYEGRTYYGFTKAFPLYLPTKWTRFKRWALEGDLRLRWKATLFNSLIAYRTDSRKEKSRRA